MQDYDLPTLKRKFEEGISNYLNPSINEMNIKDILHLYDICFKLCTFEHEKYVYDCIKTLVKKHCETIKQDIEKNFNEASLHIIKNEFAMVNKDVRKLIVDSFCQMKQNEIEKELLYYKVQIVQIRRIAGYLERAWIPIEKKQHLLEAMMQSWNDVFATK